MIDPHTILQSAEMHSIIDWAMLGSLGIVLLMILANLVYGILVLLGLVVIGIQELKRYLKARSKH